MPPLLDSVHSPSETPIIASAMDHYSILDHGSSSPAMAGDMSGASVSRSETASVSAGMAAANALLTKPSKPGPRFPGEDGGRSLAEMAHSDLDAALQLLADRAQYITGASGAAIALRRGEHNDMLCRASVGSNAPELGALLSMEYGLSGESVRTRQVLRCDDAERDPRVNRDVCRELGIASVVVMPIVSEKQVLGVFELLSGKPRAFEERDLSALLRLSEMVETAIKHAVAAEVTPAIPAAVIAENEPQMDAVVAGARKDDARKDDAPKSESSTRAMAGVSAPAPPSKPATKEVPPAKQEQSASAPKKALFWSAAMRAQSGAQARRNTESIAVPLVLRNLQKCQACGFPVSQGRTFCVECEEKQWRGQPLAQPATGQNSPPASAGLPTPAAEPAPSKAPQDLPAQPTEPVPIPESIAALASPDQVPTPVPVSDSSAMFLSSALPSESWFAANKYILGALLVVALVIVAIAWLR